MPVGDQPADANRSFLSAVKQHALRIFEEWLKMRRRRGEKNHLELLIEDLANLDGVDGKPFEPVVCNIREALDSYDQAKQHGALDASAILQFAEVHRRAIKLLPPPRHVRKRFFFDSRLMQSIAEVWSNSQLAISKLIYPKYEASWDYQHVVLGPAHDGKNATVDVIGFRKSAALDDVDLLDYPWLIHELGHSIFQKHHDTGFDDSVTRVLQKTVGSRKAKTISLNGLARQRPRTVAAQMENFWNPTRKNNWAHEIAVDIVAAWCLGPAFVEAFIDHVNPETIDPFQVDANHPPYAFRATALEECVRRLGWPDSADLLAGQLSDWNDRTDATKRIHASQYTDSDFEDALIQTTLDFLGCGSLPRCTESDFDAASSRFRDIDAVEFGIELLLDAYVAREALGEDDFTAWHSKVVKRLANDVTP